MPVTRNSASTIWGAIRVMRRASFSDPVIIQNPRTTKLEIVATANPRWAYFNSRNIGGIAAESQV